MKPRILNKSIIAGIILITGVFIGLYGTKPNCLYGDALGYYLYLPSTFIYHNLDSPDKLPPGTGIDEGKIWYLNQQKNNVTPTGHVLNQYTYGVALMESPFFFIAHTFEKMAGHKANGYSDVYVYLIKAGTLLYAILGLWLVYKILCRYFSETHSLLCVALLFLCTNLFWFSVYQAGMSHVILFFLYAQLIYLTIRLHEQPKASYFIIAGAVAGVITIIRPTDIICLLIPLLYSVHNTATIRNKIAFIGRHKNGMLLFVLAFMIPILPQLFYWKWLTGSYIFYSYMGQSFNWSHPKIKEGLFYFFNGWFPYSPVMAFSIVGMLLYRSIKNWAWCLWLLVPVYIYIIYSWYCYNYINGLGSRPMIHLYPLLAIPLAAFIQVIARQPHIIKAVAATTMAFFLALNISYSVQQLKGMLGSDESNMAYNYQILFRNHLRYKDLITRDLAERQPDTSKLSPIGTLLYDHFDDSVSPHYMRDTAKGRGYIYHMGTEEYTAIDSIVYSKEQLHGAKWFKCSGRFLYTECPGYYKHKLVLQVRDKLWKLCKIDNKIYDSTGQEMALEHCTTNKWGEVYFFTKVPKMLTDGDIIRVYIWNEGKSEMYMDNISLSIYK